MRLLRGGIETRQVKSHHRGGHQAADGLTPFKAHRLTPVNLRQLHDRRRRELVLDDGSREHVDQNQVLAVRRKNHPRCLSGDATDLSKRSLEKGSAG